MRVVRNQKGGESGVGVAGLVQQRESRISERRERNRMWSRFTKDKRGDREVLKESVVRSYVNLIVFGHFVKVHHPCYFVNNALLIL